tara:strand:- start:450 stop:680 length:231 start_codon:yes stop_codon:yes gene_type:complete
VLVTNVILQKINLAPDTGPVRLGKMKIADVLARLERHEEECAKRYTDIQRQLDKLDTRLWGIAVLIVATAIANKFV